EGVLPVQEHPADHPDHDDDAQPHGRTAPSFGLAVRLLLLAGSLGPRLEGGHVADASSATTTRKMSSSSTMPTNSSPSKTRTGPRAASTSRAASRTIRSDCMTGPSSASPGSGGRITQRSVSTCDLGTSLTKSLTSAYAGA